ncbi:hypothetical protein MBH78_08595 [Oceanimonas sp. NS1]|nr:hypothetical protein [Oceanimonas sp. NS1]
MMYWLPWAQGFTLGAGLIIPIGAQNAFVLNQACGGSTICWWRPSAVCLTCC